MMKKTFFCAAAAAILLASCSQDDFAPSQGVDGNGNGNVTFTVSLNDKAATRAFGDGLSAQKLDYAVYDVTDGQDPVLAIQDNASFGEGLSTTVSLNLANGRDYKVAFFASNDGDVYSFDAANKKVTVDYTKTHVSANQDVDNDCFYNTVSISASDLGQSVSVTLNRPVAQLNFGTGDLDNQAVVAAYGDNLRTSVSAKGYSTLNLLDGNVKDEVDVESAVPSKVISESDGEFPVSGYSYLHCTYILVPKEEKAVAEVAMTIYNGTDEVRTIPVSNVPLQANYRTNIYGNLLTSPTDVTITKDPIFKGDYNLWQGTIEEVPEANENNEILISTPGQLAGVAKAVNAGNSMADFTIKLSNDIDLNNVNWTPIGVDDNHTFQGSFDGDNHTIYNLSIDITNNGNAVPVGLFGHAWSAKYFTNVNFDGVNIDARAISGSAPVGTLMGTANIKGIKNVKVKDVTIKSYRQTGGIVGYIYGSVEDCNAENIDIEMEANAVEDGWDNCDKAGAIIGLKNENQNSIKNNHAKNVKIKGFRDLGGLFGVLRNCTYSNNTVENVFITRTFSMFSKEEALDIQDKKKENIGPIAPLKGSYAAGLTDEGGNYFYRFTFTDQNGKSESWETGTDWKLPDWALISK